MSFKVEKTFNKLSETSFDNKATFDEVEPIYYQVCRLIVSGLTENNSRPLVVGTTNCQPHFATTQIYTVLPAEIRENAISQIYNIIRMRNLFRLKMDELLENFEINELLQKEYGIDAADLLRFNDYQQRVLYNYFYEGLHEDSVDNYLRINHIF